MAHDRLRGLLAALIDEWAYQRKIRRSLVITSVSLVAVGVGWGWAASVLWTSWPFLFSSDLTTRAVSAYVLQLEPTWLSVMLILSVLVAAARPPSSHPYALAIALRRAVEVGDTTLAPVVESPPEAPEALAPEDTSAITEALTVALPIAYVTPLALPVVAYIGGLLLLFYGGALIAIDPTGIAASIQQLLTGASGPGSMIFLLAGSAMFTLAALGMFVWGWRMAWRRVRQRRGLSVALDDLGLTFHQRSLGRRQRRITWAEMRLMARIIYKDELLHAHVVYLLDSGHQTLLWEEPPTERYQSPSMQEVTATRQANAHFLAAVILERTGLRLHDLSDAVATITGDPAATSTWDFLYAAYQAALEERDVEMATTLWRWYRPDARRLPRRLARMSSAAPSAGEPAPESGGRVSATPERLSRSVSQVSRYSASPRENRQALLRVARALIPYYPTSNASIPDESALSARYQLYQSNERAWRLTTRLLVWIYTGVMIFYLVELLILGSLTMRSVPGPAPIPTDMLRWPSW